MIKNKTKANIFKRGFTLFEMLVSCAIIVLISGVVLFNHNQFSTDIEITNVAYKIALAVREAQIYSISVKEFAGVTGGDFNTPYGLHFNAESPDSYIFYADAGEDGIYTSEGGGDMDCVGGECISKVMLGRGNLIKGFCGIYLGSPPVNDTCFFTSDLEGNAYQYVDFRFKRPNPDAIFKIYYDYEGAYASGEEILNVCDGQQKACTGWAICLISPKGKEKRVVVYDTGQISVEDVTLDTTCDTQVSCQEDGTC